MAASVHERLYQLVTGNPGTGAVTVGAAVSGYQALVAGDNANTFDICIFDVDANGNPNGKWEVQAQSAYTSATTSLARVAGNVVDGSSGPGALVNFSSGTQRVLNVLSTAGVWIIRKTGGLAGSAEVRVFHDGTNGFMQSMSGYAIIKGADFSYQNQSGSNVFATGPGTSPTPAQAEITVASDTFRITTSLRTNFEILFGGSSDAALNYVTAGVIRSTSNSGASKTWIQQTPARCRLVADVTNITTTFANISFDHDMTLIAGRKYTGFLYLPINQGLAADGFKLDMNGGTATVTSIEYGFAEAIGATVGTRMSAALATAITLTGLADTNDVWVVIPVTVVCNTAGTLIPRQAKNADAGGATLTVRLGSFFWLEDMPA